LTEEKTLPGLQAFRKRLGRQVTAPVIAVLSRTPVTPNALTVFSLLVTLVAGALIVTQHLLIAAFVVMFASVFDIFDGALARATNRVTKFGAALDSTLDRMAEGVIFLSLMWSFWDKGFPVAAALAGTAMVTSFLVSYVRARAEGLGLQCEVGILTRSERIILLVLGLLLSGFSFVLPAVLIVIIFFSSITVGQRLFVVWQKTRG
jgi:CDP-diacylglycerol--glycerol-3-phosphate 3-phosphatidyltransferase